MSEALREVNVNGVRYFQADDVERWHRGWTNLSDRADSLEEETVALRELLEPAYVFLSRFVDTEAAKEDGFDVHAWCEAAEEAGIATGAKDAPRSAA